MVTRYEADSVERNACLVKTVSSERKTALRGGFPVGIFYVVAAGYCKYRSIMSPASKIMYRHIANDNTYAHSQLRHNW